MELSIDWKLTLRYASLEELIGLKQDCEVAMKECQIYECSQSLDSYSNLKSVIERVIKRRIKRIAH